MTAQRNGGPVAAARHQRQTQIVDERVEESGPVVVVADGSRTDVHERHCGKEHADLNQRLGHGQRHAEDLAVAGPVARPLRQQLRAEQDQAEHEEDQPGDDGDQPDLKHL